MNYLEQMNTSRLNQGYGADAPVRFSPLENIHKAAMSVSELEGRIRFLAERLVGPWKTDPQTGDGAIAAAPPLIDALGTVGIDMCAAVGRMNRALDAIDAKLPS